MDTVYYTCLKGHLDDKIRGRASDFFVDEIRARNLAEQQSARAEAMGLTARYIHVATPFEKLTDDEKKNIRK